MSTGFICPFPLTYGIETDNKVVWASEDLNCAVRCPTVTYTEDEWDEVTSVAWLLFMLSLFGTCGIFFYQIYRSQLKNEFLPRLMFLFGFFAISFLLVIFLSVNESSDGAVVCEEDAAYIERAPLCVIQAASTIFFIIWIEIWSFFMALENYLFICSALEQTSKHGKNNKIYLAVSLTVCSVCVLIPLGAGNLGFDYEANVPICLYLVSDTRNYLWATLIAPFSFFAVLCLIFTLLSIGKIQAIFVSNEKYASETSNPVVQLSSGSSGQASALSKNPHRTTVSHSGGKSSLGKSELYGDDRFYATDENFDESVGHHDEPHFEDYVVNPTQNVVPLFEMIWRHIKRTWRYNGRQMIFFSTFCLLTLAIVPVIIYAYGVKFDEFINGTEEYIECLLVASGTFYQLNGPSDQQTVDDFAQDKCGKHPSDRPKVGLVWKKTVCDSYDLCANIILWQFRLFV